MDKQNLKLLLSKLNDLENNKSTLRKIKSVDLISNQNFVSKNINSNQNKIKSYRMQEEHGEKKFIKP
jgi:hypothetical protein